ncbi:MAG: sugar ABC transporter permease [Chloroflexi bacterium AL-W]|nr:sugar ABC transporter permease [Chloroflexi bacterium AL-N1]NOK69447.1 sugar ABC transporter permease [Chloroflexi bacterium AL-N10]NOK77412.1 sugar ABC transporter permease [Chloroflexi bacterium AL-N5]NOK84263.1 sugar ABC transporter permease [Chloroflexi bacterium AL-W]NOK91572.1 sugar ABC transporter permease [Chloroflexi bacterium AL-N15]
MHRRSDKLLSIVLISPSIIAVAIFVYGFILWSVRVSLSDWQGLIPNYEWVGFQNYINLLSDARFHIGIRNTIIFTTLFVGGA